jgi:hypothetical protein
MPGMNTGLNATDPAVIAAFKAVLLHQGLIALLIFGTLGLAWVSVRAWLPAAGKGTGTEARAPGPAVAEPAWRLLLRTGFGILWLLDGILQAQPQMAIGLPSQVIQPTAASSPSWVQHVVNWAGTSWSYHPLQAGAAAVWIQAGLGSGCSPPCAARCPALPDWPAPRGAWWSGCSANPSAGSSPPA